MHALHARLLMLFSRITFSRSTSYAFTPSSPSCNVNAYPPEFTTATPFLTTEMTFFSFLLLNLTFRFTLPLSVYVSCYLLSAIELPSCSPLSCLPYPCCFYIPVVPISLNFFFCSYFSKIVLMFVPCLTLFDIHVRTWLMGW